MRTPIWFSLVDQRLWMMTGGDSGKVKRVRHTARVRVAPCDARGSVHGSWREGTARIVEDPRERVDAQAMLRAKYGWQARLLDLVSRLSGRYRQRVWLEITLR